MIMLTGQSDRFQLTDGIFNLRTDVRGLRSLQEQIERKLEEADDASRPVYQ